MKKLLVVLFAFFLSFGMCFCPYASFNQSAEATETYKATLDSLGFEVSWKVDGEDNWYPIKDCAKITITSDSNINVHVEVYFKKNNQSSTTQTADSSELTYYYQKFQAPWTNCTTGHVVIWVWTGDKTFNQLTASEKANPAIVLTSSSLVLHY